MSTSVELSIYRALKSAGVDDEKATAAAESVVEAIDKRHAIHSRLLATSGDVEKVPAELERVRIEVAKSETCPYRFRTKEKGHIKWPFFWVLWRAREDEGGNWEPIVDHQWIKLCKVLRN